jgi:hypothetical protein
VDRQPKAIARHLHGANLTLTFGLTLAAMTGMQPLLAHAAEPEATAGSYHPITPREVLRLHRAAEREERRLHRQIERQADRREYFGNERRVQTSLETGFETRSEIIINPGRAPNLQDATQAAQESLEQDLNRASQGRAVQVPHTNITLNVPSAITNPSSIDVEGSLNDAGDAALDQLNPARMFTTRDSAQIITAGGDVQVRLLDQHPFYLELGGELGITQQAGTGSGSGSENRWRLVPTELNTGLSYGRPGHSPEDLQFTFRPLLWEDSPASPEVTSYTGLEADIGTFLLAFEPLYCIESDQNAGDRACLRRATLGFGNEMRQDRVVAGGFEASGAINGQGDWTGDAEAHLTVQFHTRGTTFQIQGRAGVMAGQGPWVTDHEMRPELISVMPEASVGLRIAPRARARQAQAAE